MNIEGDLNVLAREGIEPPTRGFSMACCKISFLFSPDETLKNRVCYRMCYALIFINFVLPNLMGAMLD